MKISSILKMEMMRKLAYFLDKNGLMKKYVFCFFYKTSLISGELI